jgi:hypothetical protein
LLADYLDSFGDKVRRDRLARFSSDHRRERGTVTFAPGKLDATVIVGDVTLPDPVSASDSGLRAAIGTPLACEGGTDMVGQAASESSGSTHWMTPESGLVFPTSLRVWEINTTWLRRWYFAGINTTPTPSTWAFSDHRQGGISVVIECVTTGPEKVVFLTPAPRRRAGSGTS